MRDEGRPGPLSPAPPGRRVFRVSGDRAIRHRGDPLAPEKFASQVAARWRLPRLRCPVRRIDARPYSFPSKSDNPSVRRFVGDCIALARKVRAGHPRVAKAPFSLPKLVNFWDCGVMKTIDLVLDRDHPLDLPVGAILRLAPMRDEDGVLFAYWVIDDATGEPLDLVAAEHVRVSGE
jgi:hypothetical protein